MGLGNQPSDPSEHTLAWLTVARIQWAYGRGAYPYSDPRQLQGALAACGTHGRCPFRTPVTAGVVGRARDPGTPSAPA